MDVETVFEQVGCEAVPECMHGDIFGDVCFANGFIDDVLDAAFSEYLPGSLSFKEIGLWLDFGDIFFESIDEQICKDDIAVLSAFCLPDMYLFALEIYIGDFKMAKFIHPKPGCISKGEEEAVFEESWGSKDVLAFLFGEDCWECLGMFDGRHL